MRTHPSQKPLLSATYSALAMNKRCIPQTLLIFRCSSSLCTAILTRPRTCELNRLRTTPAMNTHTNFAHALQPPHSSQYLLCSAHSGTHPSQKLLPIPAMKKHTTNCTRHNLATFFATLLCVQQSVLTRPRSLLRKTGLNWGSTKMSSNTALESTRPRNSK